MDSFEQYLVKLLPLKDEGTHRGKVTVPVDVSNLGYGTFLKFKDGTGFLVRMMVGIPGDCEVFPWGQPIPEPSDVEG